jgi:hypothetical protein
MGDYENVSRFIEADGRELRPFRAFGRALHGELRNGADTYVAIVLPRWLKNLPSNRHLLAQGVGWDHDLRANPQVHGRESA